MKKLFLTLTLAASVLLTGCGTLIPKKVEFFQDKVHTYPELTTSQKEVEKQAALRAKEAAQQTLVAAVAEQASTNVVTAATDTAVLAEAVSVAVGPPVKPSVDSAKYLAEQVYTGLAKHDRKVDTFKQDNNENAGKKIEGTGFLQIPYFYYIGLIALFVFVAWHLAHTVLTGLQAAGVANPAAGVAATIGLGAMNVASSTVQKGLAQVIKGGEDFKTWVGQQSFTPDMKQIILDAFKTNQQKAQDQDVQEVVKAVTK